MQPFSKLGKLLVIALCCVLLVFMTAEAGHMHHGGVADTGHCPLCLAAHVPLAAESTLAHAVVLAFVGAVPVAAMTAAASQRKRVYRIRPPPVSPVIALHLEI